GPPDVPVSRAPPSKKISTSRFLRSEPESITIIREWSDDVKQIARKRAGFSGVFCDRVAEMPVLRAFHPSRRLVPVQLALAEGLPCFIFHPLEMQTVLSRVCQCDTHSRVQFQSRLAGAGLRIGVLRIAARLVQEYRHGRAFLRRPRQPPQPPHQN